MQDAILSSSAGPPPYPATVKSNGWKFEVDASALAQSETWAIADEIPMARHCALMSWLVSWGQVPCGSMPNSDLSFRALAKIPASLWPEVRGVVLRGWWLADDGRLYHDTLTKRVVEMLRRRRKDADRKALDRAFESADVRPASDRTKAAATRAAGASDSAGVHWDKANVRADKANVRADSAGVHPQSSTENGELSSNYGVLSESVGRALACGSDAGPLGEDPPQAEPEPDEWPEPEPVTPTPAGAIGKALIAAGLPPTEVRLSDPRLLALIAQGVDATEFAEVAAEAMRKDRASLPWVMATIKNRRAEAAALELAPKTTTNKPSRFLRLDEIDHSQGRPDGPSIPFA